MPLRSAKKELHSFLSHFEASTCSGSAGTPRPTQESPLFSVFLFQIPFRMGSNYLSVSNVQTVVSMESNQ